MLLDCSHRSCTRMLAVPGDVRADARGLPPKKIVGGIEEIRANTTRILELLEERTPQAEAKPQEEPLWTTADEQEMPA